MDPRVSVPCSVDSRIPGRTAQYVTGDEDNNDEGVEDDDVVDAVDEDEDEEG